MKKKQQRKIAGQRLRRIKKVRAKVSGTSKVPRLAVYRTLNNISAQIIDDTNGKTLVSAHQKELKKSKKLLKSMDAAKEVGKLIAEKAQKAKISKVVFDRRFYKYHGRVKALADAAREAGLEI